ncbi:unnamed protein product [Allacma fusca]|uniref:Uncharacterized protein n=1 Tax=Allacma fusca TaxID=39272 RepID=A0A8J2L4H3_9HEXA|nr:unnamed protein product [Allacma fusca]
MVVVSDLNYSEQSERQHNKNSVQLYKSCRIVSEEQKSADLQFFQHRNRSAGSCYTAKIKGLHVLHST